MGILQRFADLMSANINDLLDKAEKPEKMAKEYLRQTMEDLAEVKQETAGVMAEEKRCLRNLESAKKDVAKYDNLARQAVAAGNDDDARVFLSEKNKALSIQQTAQAAYDAAKQNADKMRELYTKLSSDASNLQTRLKNIQAMSAVANAQETVSKMTGRGYGNGMAKFDAMEEKVRQKLDSSSAAMELSSMPTSEADALAAKYNASSAGVDDELAKLKAEMGIGGAASNASVEDELAAMKKEAGQNA